MHTPVLLKEAIEKLDIKADGIYFDGTLGEAGHSYEILKRLNKKGILISTDKDIHAIEFVKSSLKYKNYLAIEEKSRPNWIIINDNFANIEKFLREQNIARLDGIILDLGLSSRQIDIEEKGFSYKALDQDLDMRMDESTGVKAKDLLVVLNESELEKLFKTYGDEMHSRRIAKEIKKSINSGEKIETVGDLKEIIYKALPINSKGKKDPSRRIFQALRIAVNDELNDLKEIIKKSDKLLKEDGKIVIISFHSLEDRVVKEALGKDNKNNYLEPTEEEKLENPRSSSAKLRWKIKTE